MTDQSRNSSIEILRLISAFLIVLHHYCIHGGMFSFSALSPSAYTLTAGASLGKWGVDLFILITGYFLSSAVPPEKVVQRLIKFYVQVWTTSVLCLLMVRFGTDVTINFRDIVTSLLPIGYNKWWFATGYFVLLVLSPFINVMLSNLSQKQHKILITVMLLLWSVPIIVLPHASYAYSENLSLFIMLYVIAAYIRRYVVIKPSPKWFWGSIFSIAIMMLCAEALLILSAHFPVLQGKQLYLVSAQSPLTIASVVSTLMAALSAKRRQISLINKMAATSFGIYLFTDNPFIRPILWLDIVQTKNQFYSEFLPIVMIGSVFCVFLTAGIFEIVRQIIVQRPILSVTTLLIEKIKKIN
jgi:hypothetical protein